MDSDADVDGRANGGKTDTSKSELTASILWLLLPMFRKSKLSVRAADLALLSFCAFTRLNSLNVVSLLLQAFHENNNTATTLEYGSF